MNGYYQQIIKTNITQIAVLKSGELVGFLGYEVGRYLFEYEKSYRGKSVAEVETDSLAKPSNIFPL